MPGPAKSQIEGGKSGSVNNESSTKALVAKLEALGNDIKAIQEDIDNEMVRKAEAELKLKKINDELANIPTNDKNSIKRKIRSEINDLVTSRVFGKVEIERKTKECEELINERGFMINELEEQLKQYRLEFKTAMKEDIKKLKEKIKDTTQGIESYKKSNIELQDFIKADSIKNYEITKQAEELREALSQYTNVRDTLNHSVKTPAMGAQRPVEKPSSGKKIEPKVAYKKVQPKMEPIKKQAVENPVEDDDAFWFNGDNA